MSSWDWYFELAERCVDQCDGDRERAIEMMVKRCLEGIPQWVLEHECRSYIDTALHHDEIEGMEPEEIIKRGLEVGMVDAQRRRN
jgi:hypothetical protein